MPLSRALAQAVPIIAAGLLGTIGCSSLAAQEHAPEGTTVGGYGEAHYTNATGPNTPGQVNLARFVLSFAHSFDERLSLHSELEIEDAKVAGGESGGEVSVEQVYLDFHLADWLTLRTGLLLSPIGIINETHEPPTFNGVARPAFDHDVIPTTWRELGIGVAGTVPGGAGLSYRVYLLNGLKAEGFSGEAGIRGGRQEGQEASFANPSFTGRLEWAHPGLKIGASFWYGGSANGDPALGTGTFAAPVALLSADARYDVGGASFRAVLANVNVSDAGPINAQYGLDVGSRIAGGYVEAAYNLLAVLAPSSSGKLTGFVRYEQYDTHAAVPAGTPQDPSLARRITTVGLSYKPTYNTVFKGDYQVLRNQAGAGEVEVLSLGVGYQF